MLPTSNTKIGQIQPVEPQPKKKKEPRNLDDSFFREHRENAAATLAAETRFPPVLTLTLRAISAMQHAHEAEVVRLSNASIHDTDLPPLIELLHRSECGVQRLDLAFNHLTDAGLTMLADALCRKLVDVDFIWCAFELTHLYLGGNSALTDGGIEQPNPNPNPSPSPSPSPSPNQAGTYICRLPPTRIVLMPSSHPGITWFGSGSGFGFGFGSGMELESP